MCGSGNVGPPPAPLVQAVLQQLAHLLHSPCRSMWSWRRAISTPWSGRRPRGQQGLRRSATLVRNEAATRAPACLLLLLHVSPWQECCHRMATLQRWQPVYLPAAAPAGGTSEGDDVAALLTSHWRTMRRTVLKRNGVPEFAFRQYLFASQVGLGGVVGGLPPLLSLAPPLPDPPPPPPPPTHPPPPPPCATPCRRGCCCAWGAPWTWRSAAWCLCRTSCPCWPSARRRARGAPSSRRCGLWLSIGGFKVAQARGGAVAMHPGPQAGVTPDQIHGMTPPHPALPPRPPAVLGVQRLHVPDPRRDRPPGPRPPPGRRLGDGGAAQVVGVLGLVCRDEGHLAALFLLPCHCLNLTPPPPPPPAHPHCVQRQPIPGLGAAADHHLQGRQQCCQHRPGARRCQRRCTAGQGGRGGGARAHARRLAAGHAGGWAWGEGAR